jgi:very-short-patch-repair endonuclease
MRISAMQHSPTDPRLLANARRLRVAMTDAERRLWSRPRGRQLGGLKFRRQVPLNVFIADFYCDDALLDVELDGGQHNNHAGREADNNRDAALAKMGVLVLRFWDPDVLKHTDVVLNRILQAATERSRMLATSPPARGRWPEGTSGEGALAG